MSFFIEKTGMRVFPTLISFIMLLIFLAPFTVGIINIGNVTGAIVSAASTVIFALFKPFSHMVASAWQSSMRGKILISAVSAVAIICIVTALAISCLMVKASHDNPDGRATTVVVLGCKVKDGRPSLMLRRRLDAAYEYLSENEDVTAIVSGGKGDDELISEAQCMSEYLISKGISPERIIMEDKSESTYENLKFSQSIINERGLEEHITIVSDGYHQLRAELIADSLGIEAYNISAPTSWWLVPTYWVREWFGVIYQVIR